MTFSNLIDLFLTGFGWQLYAYIWALFTSTGLVYLPLISLIVSTVYSSVKSDGWGSAESLHQVEIDLIEYILVIIICCVPLMSFDDQRVSSVQNPFVINSEPVKIPIFFYAVITLGDGINAAIQAEMPDKLQVRQTVRDVDAQRVDDPRLRGELQYFISDCYQPSVAAYVHNFRDDQGEMTRAEQEDSMWIGSGYFLKNNYKNQYSKHQIKSFPFDRNRESDASYVTSDQPDLTSGGFPRCDEWWVSLRERLVAEFPPSLYTRVNYLLQPGALRNAQDAVLAKVLSTDKQLTAAANIHSWSGTASTSEKAGDWISQVVAAGGGILASLLSGPLIAGLQQGLPLVQAMLLFFIYFLLPWVFLVARFKTGTMVTAAVAILAIKFWSTIWAVLYLLDESLLGLIQELSGSGGFMRLSNGSILLETVLNLVIAGLYVGAPYYFMSLFSWAKMTEVASGSDSAKAASEGSKKGAETANSAATSKFKK